jgi:hypothetical protein
MASSRWIAGLGHVTGPQVSQGDIRLMRILSFRKIGRIPAERRLRHSRLIFTTLLFSAFGIATV